MRKLIGTTKPLEAEPGTLPGDLVVIIGRNVIDGTDPPETSPVEMRLWFQPTDLAIGVPTTNRGESRADQPQGPIQHQGGKRS